MSEVIEIRPLGDGGHQGQPPPGGRRVVAMAVVAVVVVFAAAYLLWGNHGGGPHPPTRTAGEAALKGAEAEVVAVAGGALDAWGRFGVGGDLTEVARYFDPEGPQFARFRLEAPEVAAHAAGPPPYRFAMSGASADRNSNEEWVVRGPVVVSRPGEVDQRFSWELVVRHNARGWAVWTVRNLGAGPASTVGGSP